MMLMFFSIGRCKIFVNCVSRSPFRSLAVGQNGCHFSLSLPKKVSYLAVVIFGVVIDTVTAEKKLPPNHDITFT